MFSAAHWTPTRSRVCLAAAGLALAAAFGGCYGVKSAEERFDAAAKELPHFHKQTTAKFAGKVLVDGQPLAVKGKKRLFIVLSDLAHPDDQAKRRGAIVERDGSFEFMTYLEHDGVPVGKYVVTFVVFGRVAAAGRALFTAGVAAPIPWYGGGDGLKNLYSDPDKNAKDGNFVVDVEKPGKTDYAFDLALAGKEPAQPSPHAVQKLPAYY